MISIIFVFCAIKIATATFVFPPRESICNSTRRSTAMEWIKSHRGSTGLVLSFISDQSWTQNRGYTYDNALAAISLLLHSDSDESENLMVAEGILNALSSALVTDSSDSTIQYSLFYINIESGSSGGSIRSGQNAWVAESFALHWLITGSNKYESALRGISNYLLSRISASGTNNCITGGPDVTWCSVEHAIDSYFALHLAAYLTGNSLYAVGASTIADSLYSSDMWNSAQGRFNQGFGDPYRAMDVNSWGSIFLLDGNATPPTGVIPSTRVTSALSYLDSTFLSSQASVLNGENATGYGPYADSSNNFHSTAVWSEGTLGVALAHRRNGDLARAEQVVQGLDSMWASDGSLLYAAAETVVDISGESFYPYPSLAGTGWYGIACADKHWAFWRADNEMYEAVEGSYLIPPIDTPTAAPSVSPTVHPTAEPTEAPSSPFHSPSFSCPPGFSSSEGAGCLYVATTPKSQNKMNKECKLYGGLLVKVENHSMGIALTEHITSAISFGSYWHETRKRGPYIGLRYSTSEGKWKWPDGSPLGSYAPWRSGYGVPTKKKFCVITLYDGTWANVKCFSDRYGVCSVSPSASSQYRVIESSHPYDNNEKVRVKVAIPNTVCYHIEFDPNSVTDSRKDRLALVAHHTDSPPVVSPRKYFKTHFSEDIEVNATSFLKIKFRSDGEGTAWGYKLHLSPCVITV